MSSSALIAAASPPFSAAHGVRPCLLLAKSGLPCHVAGTSAYPPTSDIRWPMSVIVLISSALPPAPDVGGTPGECLNLTHFGH